MTRPEYQVVTYADQHYDDGSPVLVSKRTLAMLDAAATALGYELTLAQGSYHKGVTQSAETHWDDGVVDLEPYEWEAKCEALMKVGFMPFHRQEGWDGPGSSEHIHAVDAGSEHLNYQAAAQRVDWAHHLNGLADHAYYDGPWHRINKYVWEAPTKPPAQPGLPWPGLIPLQEALFAARTAAVDLDREHPAWKYLEPIVSHLRHDWAVIHEANFPSQPPKP